MPLPKRRKLSVDEQDGKEKTRNRLTTTDRKSAKQTKSDGTARKAPAAQVERRSSRHERKVEASTATAAAATATTTATTAAPTVATTAAVSTNQSVDAKTAVADSREKVSSSGRVIKLTRKGNGFQRATQLLKQAAAAASATAAPKIPKASVTNTTAAAAKPKRKKKKCESKKRWEKWGKFEQDAFFEGLFEYGKDFDAIQNFISIRSKKRGVPAPDIKTKEQVRHMYYRTWAKIIKFVHMDEALKKETQELYGLINYGVFRKAFKNLDERTAVHLNELIHTGACKVRTCIYSGKNPKKKKSIRKAITKCLRTPVCPALKKLNNIPDTKEEVPEVPTQVTVELTPRTAAAWVHIHNMSKNPRVRFQVSSNRSLSSLMEHLCKKWIGAEDRLRRKLGAETEDPEELVVFPHHSYTLTPVTITNRSETTADLITLAHYRESVLDSPAAGSKSSRRSADDLKICSDNSSDAEAQAHEPAPEPPKPRRVGVKVNLFQKTSEPFSSCDDENAMFPDTLLSSSPAPEADSEDKTKGTSSTGPNTEDPAPTSTSNCDTENHRPATPVSESSPNSKDKRDGKEDEKDNKVGQLVDMAVKGFTRESCKLVTLVQLSLMLGNTSHIRLEYEWRPKRQLSMASSSSGVCIGGIFDKDPMTNMLRRLANLAVLEYRDSKQRAKQAAGGLMSQCTLCGHNLERPTNTRRKTTSDVATETEPLSLESVEKLVPGAVNILRPTKLNSNGTIVGMSNFLDKDSLTPDTDGVFRVPMPMSVPVVRGNSQQRMTSQPTVTELIRPPEPRHTKNFLIPRKRKQPRKPVIVQRTLLPKIPTGQVIVLPQNLTPGSTVEQQHILPTSTVTTVADIGMTCVSDVAAVSGPMSPVMAPLSVSTTLVSVTPVSGMVSATVTSSELPIGIPSVIVSDVLNDSTSDLFASNISLPDMTSTPTKSAQQLTQSSVSPPSLSSFLDISLPASSNQGPDAGDKFLDMLQVGNSSDFTGFLKSPTKVSVPVDESANSNTLSTPPHSPRVSPLKMGADTQWLGGEGPDISLSSLLDTPIKKTDVGDTGPSGVLIPSTSSAVPASFIPAPPALFGENSQDSLVAKLDVDTTLQSVMTESSIDYSSKFEKLAAHLADNTDSAPTGL